MGLKANIVVYGIPQSLFATEMPAARFGLSKPAAASYASSARLLADPLPLRAVASSASS